MARFAWVTYDPLAKVVVVDADDKEAAKAKVVDHLVEVDRSNNEDECVTEEELRAEWLSYYGQTGEDCGWHVCEIADEPL